MPNLSFELEDKPTGIEYCYYCGEVITEKYVVIEFEGKSTIHIETGECWDNFVVGVHLINEQVAEPIEQFMN